jgi:putative ABC transport system permease protein
MKISRSIRISRKQLLSHRLRTALALLGIIIGVSAVIVMVAIGNGARKEVLSQIESMGTDLIIVNAGQVQKSTGRLQVSGIVSTLTQKDSEQMLENCPDVRTSVPVQTKVMIVKSGNLSTNTTITGTSETFQEVRNFYAETGRFFNDDDEKALARVAVLGKTVSENLFGSVDPVGEKILIGRITFNVIGVMQAKGIDLNGVDQDDQIFIPINTALRRVFNVSHLSSVLIQPSVPEKTDAAVSQVREFLRESHRLDKLNKPDDFTIQTQIELRKVQEETSGTFTNLIAGIAGISLLIGGIGILAIMLIAVKERINEIGLRLAVGASKQDILLQFLIESTILSITGGIIGILTGLAVSGSISFFSELKLTVSLPSLVFSFIFSLLVGIFFGVYPARKASLLDPIIALKNE